MKEISLEIQGNFTGHIFFFEPTIPVEIQLSNEKKLVAQTGEYTTQLCGDCNNNPL